MKSYTITVNGVAYDVTVEENTGSAPVASKPVERPKVKKEAPKQPTSGVEGNIKVAAGAAGKVFKIETSVGQSLKKGDTVLIIEAMKMEIPVVAPEDGTVASFLVKVGDSIEAGATLATMN
jgi:biotin carboxyl carrier protein